MPKKTPPPAPHVVQRNNAHPGQRYVPPPPGPKKPRPGQSQRRRPSRRGF